MSETAGQLCAFEMRKGVIPSKENPNKYMYVCSATPWPHRRSPL